MLKLFFSTNEFLEYNTTSLLSKEDNVQDYIKDIIIISNKSSIGNSLVSTMPIIGSETTWRPILGGLSSKKGYYNLEASPNFRVLAK